MEHELVERPTPSNGRPAWASRLTKVFFCLYFGLGITLLPRNRYLEFLPGWEWWLSLGLWCGEWTSLIAGFPRLLLSWFVPQRSFYVNRWEQQKAVLEQFPEAGLPKRKIDVVITCCGEPIEVVVLTLKATLAMLDWTEDQQPTNRFQVYVLDDGVSDELSDVCLQLDSRIRYLTRGPGEARRHGKAGNLNHYLECIPAVDQLVLFLDCDTAPTPCCLERLQVYFDHDDRFSDGRLAFVQTPAGFRHADTDDPLARLQQMTFTYPLGAADSVASSCPFMGTCALFRRSVMAKVGPFPTYSLTEDTAYSKEIHAAGYRSLYHGHEYLSYGLVPSSFLGVCKQRDRWARGNLQLLMYRCPLLDHRLSWMQKLIYFNTCAWPLQSVEVTQQMFLRVYFVCTLRTIFQAPVDVFPWNNLILCCFLSSKALLELFAHWDLRHWIFRESQITTCTAFTIFNSSIEVAAARMRYWWSNAKPELHFEVTPKAIGTGPPTFGSAPMTPLSLKLAICIPVILALGLSVQWFRWAWYGYKLSQISLFRLVDGSYIVVDGIFQFLPIFTLLAAAEIPASGPGARRWRPAWMDDGRDFLLQNFLVFFGVVMTSVVFYAFSEEWFYLEILSKE